jgi:hypothetical protein
MAAVGKLDNFLLTPCEGVEFADTPSQSGIERETARGKLLIRPRAYLGRRLTFPIVKETYTVAGFSSGLSQTLPA